MTIRETEFSMPADDGHVIHGVTWSASGAPKAQVLVAHGRSEHARRYRPAAQAMAEAGYRVHAIDHRGHGASAMRAGSLGDFGPRGFDAVVDDLAVACREIRGQGPELPLLLFAHSMGSFAAQYFLLDHSALVDGIVLSGTAAVDLRDPRRSGALATDFNAGIAAPRTECDWLSRDAAVVDAYLADPLCGFMLTPESTASIYANAHRTVDPQAYREVRRSLPLALITGDRDPVNHFLEWFDPLARRLRDFGFTDVSTCVYGGARHEPLNELNRAEVLANLIAWFDRVVGRSCPHGDLPARHREGRTDAEDAGSAGSTPLRHAYGSASRAHLHHPHLLCTDVQATIDFYRNWFDAEVVHDGPYAGTRNVFMKVGRGAMHLYEKPPRGQGRNAIHHLGIQVVGLRDFFERMKAAGLCDKSELREYDGGGYFMVEAPDGVLLEVFEPGQLREQAVLEYYGLAPSN